MFPAVEVPLIEGLEHNGSSEVAVRHRVIRMVRIRMRMLRTAIRIIRSHSYFSNWLLVMTLFFLLFLGLNFQYLSASVRATDWRNMVGPNQLIASFNQLDAVHGQVRTAAPV